MKLLTVLSFVVISLAAVSAAPRTKAAHEKRSLSQILKNRVQTSPTSSTLIDTDALWSAFESATSGADSAYEYFQGNVIDILRNYRKEANDVRNLIEDAASSALIVYWDMLFRLRLEIIQEEDMAAPIEEHMATLKRDAATLATKIDPIVQTTDVEFIDTVKEWERQLGNEIDFYVQIVLKIIRQGKQ